MSSFSEFSELTRAALNGGVTEEQARLLLDMPEAELFASATAIREHFFGNRVEVCCIINSRSGNCGMDCKFCSQSGHNSTEIESFPLLSQETLEDIVEKWADYPVERCGLVTSGGALGDAEVERLAEFVASREGKKGPTFCGSLGRLKSESLRKLKEAGMRRLHHNLESAESFYPNVCTTQTWRDRLDTVHQAQELGLEVCCGGLFGLGESWEDRIDFAFSLKREGIKHVPINFLYPHPGTPMANRPVMEPGEALRIIALYRHILPGASLRICGGRVSVLKARQSEMFAAGASAFMTGNYLTIAGQGVESDLDMLERLGLVI